MGNSTQPSNRPAGIRGIWGNLKEFVERLGDPNEGRVKKAARASTVVLGISSTAIGVGSLSLASSGFLLPVAAAGVGFSIIGLASSSLLFYLINRKK